MASDSSDDDSYMHRLALDLLRKHEDVIATSRSGSPDSAAAIDDTLMAAAMATRHVVVWHAGEEPTPDQIAAFAREFPDWAVIDDACTNGLGLGRSETGAADHPLSRTDLALICRRFLAAYAHRHLGKAGSSVEEPGRAQRTRLAAGNKRH